MAGRILIVDDIATNRIVLKVKLGSAQYETLQSATGAEAIAMAREARPDLILLDAELPDMTGAEVCTRLKEDPATRDIPVVMITACQDHARKIQALRAGAAEVFWKPIDDTLLLARLRSLLRASESERELGNPCASCSLPGFGEAAPGYEAPGLTAIVAPRLDLARALQRELARMTADRFVLVDEAAAINPPQGAPVPDVFLVITDRDRPETTLRLLSELRSRPVTRNSAVCVIVPADAGAFAAIALDLGADDLIERSADAAEIALRLACQLARKRRTDRMRTTVADGLRLAVTDSLTGLHNRRYALAQLAAMNEAARRTGLPYAVMILDLDRFKAVNDTFGHAAGDCVLVEMAERLRANLRPSDMAARLGGEEFVVGAPDTTLGAARLLAERLRHAIEERPFTLADGRTVAITLSVGLALGGGPDRDGPDAGGPNSGTPVPQLLEAADRALLRSKTEGRNQVTICRTAA